MVFSQTNGVLVQQHGKFFIKKVPEKCHKSVVFRTFADEWMLHSYETSTLVKHFQPASSLQNPSDEPLVRPHYGRVVDGGEVDLRRLYVVMPESLAYYSYVVTHVPHD